MSDDSAAPALPPDQRPDDVPGAGLVRLIAGSPATPTGPPGGHSAPPRLKRPHLAVFGALGHRNFRLFFTGQLVSLVGTWMQKVAESWLVLELTNSAFYVGLVAALGSLPVLLFALYAGTVVDRVSKLRVIILTQIISMILAFILAALVFTRVVAVWHVILLATMLGVVSAFDVPARQSFFVEMVGKDDLMNAIALNSSAFNVTRILGPAVAGIVIGKLGMGLCFLLNGLSFIAVILALLAIRVPPFRATPSRHSAWVHIREGLSYIASDRRVSATVLNIAVLSVFGFPFLVLMPVVARDVLGKGALEFGWMSSAVGVGALTGALGIAAFSRQLPKGKILRVASTGFGFVVAGFALSRSFPLTLAILCLTGFIMMMNTATTNTVLQTLAPDHLRGRVMSVYTLAFVGMGPIGALQAGFVAEHFGAPATLLIGAVITTVFAAIVFARRRDLVALR